MKTYKTINRQISKLTNAKIELVKGEGYHYFVYDDGQQFMTESHMVYRLNDMNDLTWIDLAKDFYARCISHIKENRND